MDKVKPIRFRKVKRNTNLTYFSLKRKTEEDKLHKNGTILVNILTVSQNYDFPHNLGSDMCSYAACKYKLPTYS